MKEAEINSQIAVWLWGRDCSRRRGVRLERVGKLKAICNECAGQTENGIAALGSFFPIDNKAANAVEPSVRSLDNPAAGLASGMLWGVLRPSA
jgi:hypothetical protein